VIGLALILLSFCSDVECLAVGVLEADVGVIFQYLRLWHRASSWNGK